MNNKPKYHLFKNTQYALSGLVHVLKTENSFRLELFASVFIIFGIIYIDVAITSKLILLITGILVLIAALHSSLDDRLRQGAILRTLGAKRQQLKLMQWFEFLLLGSLAGIIAVAGAEIICWILYQKLFELKYSWHFSYWFWLPVLSALLIAVLANRNLIQVIKQPPLVILRKL